MVSFDLFSWDGDSPIYHQIVRFIRRGVAAGTICHGEEMPSRRVLSARLGVNPNTIQKAYRILEEEGLIASHPGAKSYITVSPAQMAAVRVQLVEAEAGRLVAGLRQSGLTKAEAMALVERLWDAGEEDNR